MRARHVVASCAVAVLAVSACSGGPGGSPGEDLTWEDSPLAEALSSVWGMDQDPEEWQREEEERQREVEELVAACMAEEGFEYTPAVHEGSVMMSEDDDWGSEEWTAQYGYGVTTDPWMDDQPVEPIEEWVDPNQDYVESMSPSEQEAFYAALHGAPMEVDEEWVEGDPEPEYDWKDAGCYGRAQHEVYEESDPTMQMWEDPTFAEFFAATEKLYEDVQRDPRMAEVNAEWAECMDEAGITGMTSPDEAQQVIFEEYDRMYQEADAQVDWENLDWESLGENTDPVRALMDEAGLADLREREIAMAVADIGCREELDTESRYLAIQFELEKELVETYRADIDAILATYGQES